jgi:tetratricopeptide (TPR) repeat protein
MHELSYRQALPVLLCACFAISMLQGCGPMAVSPTATPATPATPATTSTAPGSQSMPASASTSTVAPTAHTTGGAQPASLAVLLSVAKASIAPTYPDAALVSISAGPYDFQIDPNYTQTGDVLRVDVGFMRPNLESIHVRMADDDPSDTARVETMSYSDPIFSDTFGQIYSDTLKYKDWTSRALAEATTGPRDAVQLTRGEVLARTAQQKLDTKGLYPEIRFVRDSDMVAKWEVTYRLNPAKANGQLDLRQPLATFMVALKDGAILSRKFDDGKPVDRGLPGLGTAIPAPTLTAIAGLFPSTPPKTPTTGEGYFEAGKLAEIQGNIEEALRLYTQAILADSSNDQAYRSRASIYLNQGKCDAALSDLDALVRLQPNDADAYKQRGEAYDCKAVTNGEPYVQVELDQAIQDESAALKLRPGWAEAYTQRGMFEYHKQVYDAAIADFGEALKSDPTYVDANLDRGMSYAAQGKWDQALADYTTYIRARPTAYWAFYERGHVYRMKGDHQHAIQDFTEVLRLHPQQEGAYVQRGQSYARLGDYSHAMDDYNQALSMAHKDPWAYTARAWVYYGTKDYDHALSDFSQAISLDAAHGEAYYGRGLTYEGKNDYSHALQDYDKAIQLDAKATWAYAGRGRAYRDTGDYAQALQNFDKALELSSDSGTIYVSRGLTYGKQGDYPKAFADFDRAEKLGDAAGAYLGRGKTYAMQGNTAQASTALNEAIKLSGSDVGTREDAQAELDKLAGK